MPLSKPVASACRTWLGLAMRRLPGPEARPGEALGAPKSPPATFGVAAGNSKFGWVTTGTICPLGSNRACGCGGADACPAEAPNMVVCGADTVGAVLVSGVDSVVEELADRFGTTICWGCPLTIIVCVIRFNCCCCCILKGDFVVGIEPLATEVWFVVVVLVTGWLSEKDK